LSTVNSIIQGRMDNYSINSKLAEGGMGMVHLAMNSKRQIVIVKTPLVAGDMNDDLRIEKLKIEATILREFASSAAQHSIVKYIDETPPNTSFHLIIEKVSVFKKKSRKDKLEDYERGNEKKENDFSSDDKNVVKLKNENSLKEYEGGNEKRELNFLSDDKNVVKLKDESNLEEYERDYLKRIGVGENVKKTSKEMDLEEYERDYLKRIGVGEN